MSHSKAMAATNNAAVCPPDAIQVLQLFMNDSLVHEPVQFYRITPHVKAVSNF
ncbi:hypothetical protein [Nitrosomonas sp.]|uniref:hypothetical protein n=1 Tax=Nitrosomonas sp. TaxID=42353 RepID=UPI0025FFEA63|nr:hypothetical protein [Nitrosomonas sp.]